MVLPIYCSSVLNSWHFLGDIFNPFCSKAFSKTSNFLICICLDGVNSNKSSIIALQYFLLSKQFKYCIYVTLPYWKRDIKSHWHSLIQV